MGWGKEQREDVASVQGLVGLGDGKRPMWHGQEQKNGNKTKKWAQTAWVDIAGIIEINEHISFIFIIWIPWSVSFLILSKHTVLFIVLNET